MKEQIRISQGKNGRIYIELYGRVTPLTHKQLKDLSICLTDLEDFDFNAYCLAYPRETETESLNDGA